MSVREGCGYEFRLETSCYSPSFGADRQARVFINEARWIRGAVPFEGDVGSYRQYVINHEVGHAIGYVRHEPCDQQGGLAPVMMQQTFSTANDGGAKFDPDQVNDGKTCHLLADLIASPGSRARQLGSRSPLLPTAAVMMRPTRWPSTSATNPGDIGVDGCRHCLLSLTLTS